MQRDATQRAFIRALSASFEFELLVSQVSEAIVKVSDRGR